MQPEFWHQRWATNQIGFHEPRANPLLVAHFEVLEVAPGGRVFLPLCGKTLDIDWLLSRGLRVAGLSSARSRLRSCSSVLACGRQRRIWAGCSG